MDVYIPEHLRNIKVIDQMCKLIEGYASSYEENPESSFDDYEFNLKADPVKKFLTLCLPEESVYSNLDWPWSEDQDYDTIINYLSRLFYSVKGTVTVFTYMKKYLDLKFTDDPIIYTPDYVEFSLDRLSITDESYFRDTLEGFLNALLFFKKLNVNVGILEVKIENTITKYIQGGVVCYRYYIAKPYNN